jgi:hypothetical protein
LVQLHFYMSVKKYCNMFVKYVRGKPSPHAGRVASSCVGKIIFSPQHISKKNVSISVV